MVTEFKVRDDYRALEDGFSMDSPEDQEDILNMSFEGGFPETDEESLKISYAQEGHRKTIFRKHFYNVI